MCWWHSTCPEGWWLFRDPGCPETPSPASLAWTWIPAGGHLSPTEGPRGQQGGIWSIQHLWWGLGPTGGLGQCPNLRWPRPQAQLWVGGPLEPHFYSAPSRGLGGAGLAGPRPLPSPYLWNLSGAQSTQYLQHHGRRWGMGGHTPNLGFHHRHPASPSPWQPDPGITGHSCWAPSCLGAGGSGRHPPWLLPGCGSVTPPHPRSGSLWLTPRPGSKASMPGQCTGTAWAELAGAFPAPAEVGSVCLRPAQAAPAPRRCAWHPGGSCRRQWWGAHH